MDIFSVLSREEKDRVQVASCSKSTNSVEKNTIAREIVLLGLGMIKKAWGGDV